MWLILAVEEPKKYKLLESNNKKHIIKMTRQNVRVFLCKNFKYFFVVLKLLLYCKRIKQKNQTNGRLQRIRIIVFKV